ncbi:MAG: pirin family protein [Gammaproteobacteria bacterium]
MMLIRHAADRGHANHGWLDSHHTFSFADYSDVRYNGFGPLRVINEDRVQPGKGFGTHGHRDMEIISYVLEGELAHKDSMGTGSVIRPGDVQLMTAGTGVQHSEFNNSKSEPVHFLQIWLFPSKSNLQPGYEQKTFSAEDKRGKLKLIVSKDGHDGSVKINQDAQIYAAVLSAGETVTHPTTHERKLWLQVARGTVRANGEALVTGDGAAFAYDDKVSIEGTADSEVLLFDMVGRA